MAEEKEKKSSSFNELEAERKELRLLIERGISFTVNYQEERKVRIPRWRWLRFIKRTQVIREDKQREYIVKEPTAYTLDRLSAEYIELVMDEEKIKENPRQEARRLFMVNNKRMARIVAIAVLGNEWENRKKLEELTEFFGKWIKNSQLLDLVQAIDLTNNLADFINSMRLMSSARTTMPTRIENQEG